jgi:hypothetical protein
MSLSQCKGIFFVCNAGFNLLCLAACIIWGGFAGAWAADTIAADTGIEDERTVIFFKGIFVGLGSILFPTLIFLVWRLWLATRALETAAAVLLKPRAPNFEELAKAQNHRQKLCRVLCITGLGALSLLPPYLYWLSGSLAAPQRLAPASEPTGRRSSSRGALAVQKTRLAFCKENDPGCCTDPKDARPLLSMALNATALNASSLNATTAADYPLESSLAILLVTSSVTRDRLHNAARTWLRWVPPALLSTHLLVVSDDDKQCISGPQSTMLCPILSKGSLATRVGSQRKWRDGLVHLAANLHPSVRWVWVVDDDALLVYPRALEFLRGKDPGERFFYGQLCFGSKVSKFLSPIPTYCGGATMVMPVGVLHDLVHWLEDHGDGRRAWPPEPYPLVNGTDAAELAAFPSLAEDLELSDVGLSVALFHAGAQFVHSDVFRSQPPEFYTVADLPGESPVSWHYLKSFVGTFSLIAAYLTPTRPLSQTPVCERLAFTSGRGGGEGPWGGSGGGATSARWGREGGEGGGGVRGRRPMPRGGGGSGGAWGSSSAKAAARGQAGANATDGGVSWETAEEDAKELEGLVKRSQELFGAARGSATKTQKT